MLEHAGIDGAEVCQKIGVGSTASVIGLSNRMAQSAGDQFDVRIHENRAVQQQRGSSSPQRQTRDLASVQNQITAVVLGQLVAAPKPVAKDVVAELFRSADRRQLGVE